MSYEKQQNGAIRKYEEQKMQIADIKMEGTYVRFVTQLYKSRIVQAIRYNNYTGHNTRKFTCFLACTYLTPTRRT